MPRWPRLRLAVRIAAAAVCSLGWASGPASTIDRPYADLGTTPYAFRGSPETVDVGGDILIGMFGPTAGARGDQGGLSMRHGAELAVALANADGGYQGRRFALVHRPDDRIWGSAKEVVYLAYERRVRAVVGSVGGESTHVIQQVVTKARVPLLAPASTDSSLTQTNIPWSFRLMPSDDAISELAGRRLYLERAFERVAVVWAEGYDFRARTKALGSAAGRLGHALTLSLPYRAENGLGRQIELLRRAEPEAVVIWGQARESGRLLAEMRRAGLTQPVLGGPELCAAAFANAAGPASEGVEVIAPHPVGLRTPEMAAFRAGYEQRYEASPDYTAAYAFDAVGLVIAAVRAVGTSRVSIRGWLAGVEGFRGATGNVRFDGMGNRSGPPSMALLRDGRVTPTTFVSQVEPRSRH